MMARFGLLLMGFVPLVVVAALALGVIAFFKVQELNRQLRQLSKRLADEDEPIPAHQRASLPQRTPPVVNAETEKVEI
ncbi:MAG: hypothetical protein QF662_01130 [Phycisphaerae bacterium]|jgi:hypothetical protein|nr:hypothetical protein [Phycisphaerae bacterium]